ncbi:MAG TPA: LLM class F420-dependent oxidoreductase [Dehalococcoidia bacterium]|nr:LLM class F420-dependent oxidoreductase [Dehalococcoidia bacterium]
MRVGVVFPQTEIGADPSAIRDYTLAAEAAGYNHILAYDHVLGADPDRPGGFRGPYTSETMFHEPFVLFGYMAAITRSVELVTGVIILPQRQTALVAKQTAQIDVLSEGRFRLGIGVGWNPVEYEALGENFHDRGRRVEEQVEVLRALWGEPSISYDGQYTKIVKAGINPLPPGRSIPVWMGGMSDSVLDRIGRIADGWFPQYRDPEQLAEGLARIHVAADRADRDRGEIGVEARVSTGKGNPAGAVALAGRWQEVGATHLSVNTMGQELPTPADHIRAIERFASEYGLS